MTAKNKSYGDEDTFDLSYKTYDELVEAYRIQNAIPEDEYMQAIENTNLLYDMVEDIELDTEIKYPILYGTRENDSKKFLETLWSKFEDKLRTGVIPREQEQSFRDAIVEEVRVFEKLKMTGFMLSMSELISWCKTHHMAIGPGRGSVGGSRVAYVLDIIDLNPETWHTVFSRFANEDREEIGDRWSLLCSNVLRSKLVNPEIRGVAYAANGGV
jgi:DNA polymerase-3 subunit alpha